MKIETQVVDTLLAFCTYRAFSPRNQDCFACTKNVNKLIDCGVGGKEFYLIFFFNRVYSDKTNTTTFTGLSYIDTHKKNTSYRYFTYFGLEQ